MFFRWFGLVFCLFKCSNVLAIGLAVLFWVGCCLFDVFVGDVDLVVGQSAGRSLFVGCLFRSFRVELG